MGRPTWAITSPPTTTTTLAADVPAVEIFADYPDLEAEDIRACLQYAAAQANHSVLQAAA